MNLDYFLKPYQLKPTHLFNELINGLTYKGFVYVLLCVTIVYVLYISSNRSYFMKSIMIIVSFIFSTIYMAWRTKYTIESDTKLDQIASILLLGAEYLGYFQQGIFYFLMSLSTDKKDINIDETVEDFTVDVFVATYNEPLSVLRRTLIACTYLEYPVDKLKIYVCDDGDRTEVESLAKELGVFYIRRDDHSHAKAGNLNHAMKCTNGDLILTLDTDMVPKSDFLQKTVGYFKKRKVAFVQAPQLFFNPDPFQHNLFSSSQVTNEQDFFMIEMQAAKSHFNAVMYVGSNCIFSRAALNIIGGFATGSITEDVATGMLLQAKGYRTFAVKDVLAKGLSPESFSELIHQRDRWCRGNLQAARKWNPITYPGLSIAQRFLYFSGTLYWYFGIQKMIYIVSPIMFLDFGIKTLNASVYEVILFWFPSFISSILTFRRISGNRRTTFWSHIYETAMAPAIALSAIKETLLIKKSVFRVTKKGIANNHIQVVWSSLIPFLVLLIGIFYGFYYQLDWIFDHHTIPTYYWINDFWAFYNLISIVLSIYICIELPRPRKSERFTIKVPIELYIDGIIHRGISMDISENGARIQLFESFTGIARNFKLAIEGIEGEIPVTLVPNPLSDRFEMRLVWGDLRLEQYRELVKLLYDQKENIEKQYRNRSGYNISSTLLRSTKFHVKRLERKSYQKNRRTPIFNQQDKTISS